MTAIASGRLEPWFGLARLTGRLNECEQKKCCQPARPLRAWKCRQCEFRSVCPISQVPGDSGKEK
jgi:hypothetical protein